MNNKTSISASLMDVYQQYISEIQFKDYLQVESAIKNNFSEAALLHGFHPIDQLSGRFSVRPGKSIAGVSW